MVLTQACLCPLLSTVFGLLAFFIGYAIAVGKNHVDPFLPYISDCGDLQPESGIFGILLNFSSFFLFLTVYFIYRNFVVFEEKVQGNHLGKWKWISAALMLLGMVSSIGAAMVANFQEGPQLATHNTGAFTFFIGICVYAWGQTLVALIYKSKSTSRPLTIFRLLLCLAITGFLIFHIVCLCFNPFIEKDANGDRPKKPEVPATGIERYPKGSPFYWNHIATTLSEWILALLIEAFIVSYTYDLALTCLESPTARSHELLKHNEQSNADMIFYSNQIAPVEALMSPPENVPIMRKLPRLDTYGSYSRFEKEERRSTSNSAPYDRTKMVSSYNQFQYF